MKKRKISEYKHWNLCDPRVASQVVAKRWIDVTCPHCLSKGRAK